MAAKSLQQEIRTGARYLLASGLSFALTLTLSFVFVDIIGLPAKLAVALTLGTVFVVNFISIRWFVFRSDGNPRRQLVGFALSSLAFRGLDYGLFYLLFSLFALNYMAALGTGLLLTFIAKYFFQKHFVFR